MKALSRMYYVPLEYRFGAGYYPYAYGDGGNFEIGDGYNLHHGCGYNDGCGYEGGYYCYNILIL